MEQMYLLLPSPAMSERIYLMLGSNQGRRAALLRAAITALQEHISMSDLKCSAVYETAAWGLEEQPAFLNQALSFIADISARDLLTQVRRVESDLGRQRTEIWGPRTLDIDILFFGQHEVNEPDLIIPHPRLQDRRFVLEPMLELDGRLRHPVLRKTISELNESCTDPLPVRIYDEVTENR